MTAENQAGELKSVLSKLVNARNQVDYQQRHAKRPDTELLSRVEHTISEKNRELKDANRKMEEVRRRDERACRSRIVWSSGCLTMCRFII